MSQFVVSARKYRPLHFDDVVGQSHVTTTLKNALNVDKVAHAFLFCGPRGVGKTSCARILAKAINCLSPSEDREPCNTCQSCTSFNENASFNIIELDAASNNGVEHIRQLNEQVRFQPQQGKFKVFIIDEVHMLTTSAFNAFLKTLEEPPPYAIFILATTEKHKILPTILSRCQVFDFHRIQVQDIADHLAFICEKEGIKADPEALRLIASKADGALRDALSLFDRIATVSEKEITYQKVIDQLNILDYDYFFQFVDAFLNEDLTQVMNLFDEVVGKGFDGDLFVNGLADHLRQLLVALHPATHKLIEGGEKLKARYIDQAKRTGKGFLLTGLSLLNECDIHYPRARHKRLHVEICLSRICYMRRVVRPEQREAGTALAASPSTPSAEIKKKAPDAKPVASESKPEEKEPTASSEAGIPAETPAATRVSKVPLAIPTIQSTTELAKEIKKEYDAKPKEALILDNALLAQEWHKYLSTLQGASVKKLFESSEIDLSEEYIRIRVATQIARDTIAQDDTFIQSLREKYLRKDLKMDIQIDEEKAALIRQTEHKPLNAREKFAQLTEGNPLLLDLQKEFDLVPDGEV